MEVSATRLRSVADVDVPASVTTVQLGANGNQSETDVTEALSGLPGVTALDRQNYAQDTQLSIRGFGARATFGVRGLRLYADGIPASMPDGQGQLSHFSVMGADRLQVMRGPVLGAVRQFIGWRGADLEPRGHARRSFARCAPPGAATMSAASARRRSATAGFLDYNLAVSRFETDGYRGHSCRAARFGQCAPWL